MTLVDSNFVTIIFKEGKCVSVSQYLLLLQHQQILRRDNNSQSLAELKVRMEEPEDIT